MNKFALAMASLCLSATSMVAAEPTIMHCFAYTPIKEATQADWDAFYKATDELPGKIKGIKRVWYGKLRAPLAQVRLTDAAARKQLNADGKATGEAEVMRREHGVCMEFADEAAWKAYDADSAHKTWTDVYSKVRVPGTTTYQILPVKK